MHGATIKKCTWYSFILFPRCVNFRKEYNIVARLTDILCDILATEADLQNDTVDSKKRASCIDSPTYF
jgi:hypothetical protein